MKWVDEKQEYSTTVTLKNKKVTAEGSIDLITNKGEK